MNEDMYFDDSSKPKNSFDNFFMVYLVSKGYLKEDIGIKETFKIVFHSMEFSSIMIASLIPSLILFFVFYKTERWQSAYGLIVAVLLSMALVFCR